MDLKRRRESIADLDKRISATLAKHGFVKGCEYPGCGKSNADDPHFKNGLCKKHQIQYELDADSELEALADEAALQTKLTLNGAWG